MAILLFFGVINCSAKQPQYIKLNVNQAVEQIKKSKDFIILDVRSAKEYYEGHVENAVLLPMQDVETSYEKMLPNKKQAIFIYCRSGRRSAIVAKQLIEKGYKKVYDFGGIIDKGFTDAFKIVK